ncbi:hypothetical protein B0H13DRAFT_2507114 [Mycena leptocephala]|nr:hypothetical protein B0H13DRAFT_2507114 [Mycena leptocephala]
MHLPRHVPLVLVALLAAAPSTHAIQDWLYTPSLPSALPYLQNTTTATQLHGVQVLYGWDIPEPTRNCYNFSSITTDLQTLASINPALSLWIQLQDRTFTPTHNPMPPYLRGNPAFSNGSVPACDGSNCTGNFEVDGWVASQWNTALRGRFQALLRALGDESDGEVYGINLPETAIEIDESKNGFSNVSYFRATLENAAFARSVFARTRVVQYINFWPDAYADEQVMGETFAFMEKHDVGVGGPDDIPYHEAQEENSYPFMREYKGRLPLQVIAVQEPDLSQLNPTTGKPFTRGDFTRFAEELGCQIIFWATSTPWLNGLMGAATVTLNS